MSIEKDRVDKLLSNFASLSDVTLIAGLDRERFPVPRKMFAQSSKYFEALLGPNFREGADKEVVLENVNGPTLKAVIHFIYIGHVELNNDNIVGILAAASEFEVLPLEQKCGQYLQENLSAQNCVATLSLADKYSFGQLRANALALVCANFERISSTDISKLDGNIFGDILKQDQIEAPETKIFNYLVGWAKQNETEGTNYMPQLLKSIRLDFMPGEFIAVNVEPIFRKYGLLELFIDEYRKRSLASKPKRLHRCTQLMTKNICCASINTIGLLEVCKFTSGWEKIKDFRCEVGTFSDFGWTFHTDQIYMMGGRKGQNKHDYLDLVEYYDINTGARKTVSPMKVGRSNFKPVAFKQYIYVFGGKDETGCLNQCERYDTSCNWWQSLPDMPRKLYDCNPIEVGGVLYIVGGKDDDGRTSNIVYCIDDPETNPRLRQKTHLTGSINSIHVSKLDLTLYVSVSLSHRVNYTNLHAYDTSTDVWTMIGEIPWRTELISSIDYCGQIYIVYFDAYGKNSLFSLLTREVSSISTSREILLTDTVSVPFLSPTARPTLISFVH